MYVCEHACVYVQIYIYKCIYLWTRGCIYMYTYVGVCGCICVYLYVSMYVCMQRDEYTYMCTHTHTYIHICIHTYIIHTYTHPQILHIFSCNTKSYKHIAVPAGPKDGVSTMLVLHVSKKVAYKMRLTWEHAFRTTRF